MPPPCVEEAGEVWKGRETAAKVALGTFTLRNRLTVWADVWTGDGRADVPEAQREEEFISLENARRGEGSG